MMPLPATALRTPPSSSSSSSSASSPCLLSRFRSGLEKLLERLYDYRAAAGRGEFLAVTGANVVFATTLAVPVLAFLYWLGNYGANFSYADEILDAVFSPGNIAAFALWTLLLIAGGIAGAAAEFFAAVRRLNDLCVNRWFVLLLLVPVLNLLFVLFLIFLPGRREQGFEQGFGQGAEMNGAGGAH